MEFLYAPTPASVRSPFHCLLGVAALLACLLPGCGQPATTPPLTALAEGVDRVAQPVDRQILCRRIDAALAHARDGRRLDAAVHGAWQVVHGILAFGRDFPLAHGGLVSPAVDYLLDGGRLIGWQLRSASSGVIALVEEGSTSGQGHPNQWLGYLSQCGLEGLPRETRLVAGARPFTVNDLLTQAQADIRPGQEATWTLMAITAYLPTDGVWTASDGSRWTVERVVQMEADADLFASACGGAHRLYGLVVALRKHVATTERPTSQLTGGWAAAAAVIEDCLERAQRFQQADGSFSIHTFDRPGTSADVFARLSATGHVFEVLSLALDDDRLAEPWVTRAADRLVNLLEQTADVDVECGALYHAAHGLLLYRQRVCGSTP